ncbi:hypothetical protein BOX15_Mlig010488g3 [Macrostomum lignano]|uniref:C2H2-type domain-containing protein n=2 Tax=Macrostomum lignano TaxID=282301 RepID=A0A1I8GS07_9PLAT|nr:hypothetical protein BOX15_Mlig010488g3 [Macrostomum lignano]
MSVSNSRNSAGSSRRVKFDSSAEKASSSRQSTYSRPSPFGPEQLTNVGQFQLTSELPSGVRNFLGEEPAIMMPVPLSWSSGQDGEQKYLRDMGATIPEVLKRNLEFDFADSQSKGTPCRYCGVEFGSASLLTHQAKCKKDVEAATNDTARGTEPGYLIRNWYSRNHPLKRLEKNRHVKECRYCHSAVPWHALSQHEDECRSIMYGTTPTSGYY